MRSQELDSLTLVLSPVHILSYFGAEVDGALSRGVGFGSKLVGTSCFDEVFGLVKVIVY